MAGTLLEVSAAQVARVAVDCCAQLGAAVSVGDFEAQVAVVQRFPETLHRRIGTKTQHRRMIARTETINETLSWFTRIHGYRRRWISRQLFHLLPQTERPHIGPNFLDVCKALSFRSNLPGILPTRRILPVLRPNRILLLVIHDHFVDRFVFIFRMLQSHRHFLLCHFLKKNHSLNRPPLSQTRRVVSRRRSAADYSPPSHDQSPAFLSPLRSPLTADRHKPSQTS